MASRDGAVLVVGDDEREPGCGVVGDVCNPPGEDPWRLLWLRPLTPLLTPVESN